MKTTLLILMLGVASLAAQTNWTPTDPAWLAVLKPAHILSPRQVRSDVTNAFAAFTDLSGNQTNYLRGRLVESYLMEVRARSKNPPTNAITLLNQTLRNDIIPIASLLPPTNAFNLWRVTNSLAIDRAMIQLAQSNVALAMNQIDTLCTNQTADPFIPNSAPTKIELLFAAGKPAQALNVAEAATNSAGCDNIASLAAVLNGIGWRGAMVQQPLSDAAQAFITNVEAPVQVRRFIRTAVSQGSPQDWPNYYIRIERALLYLRADAGTNLTEITRLRRLIRQVSDAIPLTENSVQLKAKLRAWHRDLKFTNPDPSDPEANATPRKDTGPLAERMLAMDGLYNVAELPAHVPKPYPHSVWGEKFKRGLTDEEAAAYCAQAAQ